jgi:hypothetical protein
MTNDRDEIYDDDDDDDDAYLARRWDGVPELIYSHCYTLVERLISFTPGTACDGNVCLSSPSLPFSQPLAASQR